MRFGRMRSHFDQSTTPQNNSRSQKVFPPWEDTHFKITPSRTELESMRDGEKWKKTAIVRFLDPGDAGPYIYRECYAGGRSHIATFDTEGFDGKDVIRHHYNLTPNDEDHEKQRRNLWHSTKWAMEVVDLRWFHVDMIDVDGNQRMIYHECEGDPRRCSHCKDGLERVFGGHKVWSMSKNRFGLYCGIDDELFNIAINDDEEIFGKKIYPGTVGFYCSECNYELVGEKDIQTMAPDDVNQAYYGTHTCPECNHKGKAKELALVECDSGAKEAERASAFDKNIKVVCTGEKYTDRGVARSQTSSINLQLIHDGIEFSSIHDDLAEAGVSEDDVEALFEPMDLAWVFRPEMLDPKKFDSQEAYVQEVLNRQAKAIGKENPYKNDVSNSSSKSLPFQSRSGEWRRQ